MIYFYLGCLEGLSFLEKMTYDLIEELGGQDVFIRLCNRWAASSIVGLQIRADVMRRPSAFPSIQTLRWVLQSWLPQDLHREKWEMFQRI